MSDLFLTSGSRFKLNPMTLMAYDWHDLMNAEFLLIDHKTESVKMMFSQGKLLCSPNEITDAIISFDNEYGNEGNKCGFFLVTVTGIGDFWVNRRFLF